MHFMLHHTQWQIFHIYFGQEHLFVLNQQQAIKPLEITELKQFKRKHICRIYVLTNKQKTNMMYRQQLLNY